MGTRGIRENGKDMDTPSAGMHGSTSLIGASLAENIRRIFPTPLSQRGAFSGEPALPDGGWQGEAKMASFQLPSFALLVLVFQDPEGSVPAGQEPALEREEEGMGSVTGGVGQ